MKRFNFTKILCFIATLFLCGSTTKNSTFCFLVFTVVNSQTFKINVDYFSTKYKNKLEMTKIVD